jgi:hypothetical protein
MRHHLNCNFFYPDGSPVAAGTKVYAEFRTDDPADQSPAPVAASVPADHRARFTFAPDAPVGVGANVLILIAGHVWQGRQLFPSVEQEGDTITLERSTGTSPFDPGRPAPVRQTPLPPFDHDDPGGAVHTTLPPEQVIPSGPDRDWWRGDFGGVTLTDTPPFFPGANSAIPKMTMSFQLPYYDRHWQDVILTAHAERGYTHFHLDRFTWQQKGLSPTDAIALMASVQSWGFFTSYWGIGTLDGHFTSWAQASGLYQPVLDALQAAGPSVSEKTILIVGEELNSCTSPEGLLDIVQHLAPQCRDLNIPLWLHFTSNYPAWPIGSQSKVDFWRVMLGLGVKGLCWQADPFDPAGTMGARMYDSRRYLADAGGGKLAAFELRAFAQLQGRFDEDHGCLTGWEMLCATHVPGSHVPAVAGFANGARYPDGSAI